MSYKLLKDDGSGGGDGVVVGDWMFNVCSASIGTTAELDALSAALNIKTPTMLFPRNSLSTRLDPPAAGGTAFSLSFRVDDALKAVGAADPLIRVRAANEWTSRAVRPDVLELPNASDWTFSTTYMGTIHGGGGVRPKSARSIDYDKLRDRSVPIIYFNEVTLFEDELDDNGVAICLVRVRVSQPFFLILLRFWLRVDDVLFRVYDTRYYHEFGSDVLIREWSRKEASFRELKDVSRAKLNNPDLVVPMLRLVESGTDEILVRAP